MRKLLSYQNLLFVLVLANSACFFLTDDKKAGIPYLRELFLLAILAASALLLVTWKRLYQSKACLWVVFIGICLPVMSSILAKLNFGQPIVYGLLEERRSFYFLIFFPTLFLLYKAKPTEPQLERFFLVSGLFCVAVGFLYYFKIIPQNSGFAFEVDAKELGSEDSMLRPNRYRIGSGYVSICAFMIMYSLRRQITLARVMLLLLFTAYLWLVLQTRSTMVVWALAGLWIFRDRIGSLLKLGAVASVILVVSYFMIPDFYATQFERFDALLNEATTGPGVRNITTGIILQEVAKNWYIGMGALSLQWNGGFSTLYNPWFYLSDVGIVGVYYRFGFLTPVIALVFYGGFLSIMRDCKNKGDLLSAMKLPFVFGLINMFLSNSIMYGGDLLGISAACFLYFSRVRAKAPAPSTTHNERISYDKFQHRYH